MTPLSLRSFIAITISFLLAFVLSIIPLPVWANIARPQWLALIIFYWVLALPHRVSLKVAWLLGLILDALYGTVLGEHALAATVLAYLGQKFYLQIRMFPLLQQTLIIGVLIILYQTLLLWIQAVLGQLASGRWFWPPALTSMLVWPWLFLLLRSYQQRFRIY